MTDISWKLFTS